MAFNVNVTDRIDMRMYGTLLGQRIISTFSFQCVSGSGPIDWAEVVSDLEAAFSAAGNIFPRYRAICPDNYVFNFAQWQLAKAGARYLNTRVTHEQAGTSTDVAETANLAAVLLRRGDGANRRNVSTLHVPIGTTDVSLVDGYLTAGIRSALVDLGTALKGTWSAAGGGNGLDFQSCIPNGPFSGQSTPLTYTAPQDTIRVMRRRTVGLGI